MNRSCESKISLVLFFTEGMSLAKWHEKGVLERELALYRRIARKGLQVTFVTYGGPDEIQYLCADDGISIISNRHGLSGPLYKLFLIFRYFTLFRNADLIKTNQVSGSAFALLIKRIFGKKVIVRCGFVPSLFAGKGHYATDAKTQGVMRLERAAFCMADHIVVPAEGHRRHVSGGYQIPEGKISVIPNYVDTDVFRPMAPLEKVKGRICTIAKDHPQKNIETLIEALRGMRDRELVLIGSAGRSEVLLVKARESRVNLKALGIIPTSRILEELGRAELFVMPSLYEGHPKALLEAMSCGLPVIGCRVEGIEELITHGVNGYLCGTSAENLRGAIETVMADADLRRRMGEAARQTVLGKMSLCRVLDREMEMYQSLLGAQELSA